MKKPMRMLFALVLMCSLLTACSDRKKPEPPQATAEPTETPTATAEPTETPEETKEETTTPKAEESTAANQAGGSGDVAIDAVDANQYNTKENPVPLGQWVTFTYENMNTDEYVPFYMRITKVSRDPAEVEATLAAYDGYMDYSLTEDQARDIEFGLVEYEYYYAPDYEPTEYGSITPANISLNAKPISTNVFESEGVSFIGVGTMYNMNSTFDADIKPGDTCPRKGIFTVLKSYDESKYVFHYTWYEGKIDSANARDLYFATTQ